MKKADIKSYELGESCFGPILRINNKDFHDELSLESSIEFINEMLTTDVNRSNIIKECLEICLEHLQGDCINSHSDKCDQCGNYNFYAKYEINE